MRRQFRPVMLVGLGPQGASVAQGIHDVLLSRYPDLAPILLCLTLDAEGGLTRHDAAGPEACPLADCPGLRSELTPGVFAANAAVIRACERKLADTLVDQVSVLRRQEALSELIDQGWSIDDGLAVYVISALSDPVGSGTLLPFLGLIQSLASGRLRGTTLHVDVVGFFPDAFPEFRNSDLAHARAYATVQELDHVAEHPDLFSSTQKQPFDQAFLLTRNNEASKEVDSAQDLTLVVGEMICLLLGHRIASDSSYMVALLKRVEDKAARFSSMGLAKLVFPVDEIMQALAAWLAAELLGTAMAGADALDRDRVAAEVKQFVVGEKLDRLADSMLLDDAGKSIWRDFMYDGPVTDRASVNSFLEAMDRQASEFARLSAPEMTRRLAVRRDSLLRAATEAIRKVICQCLDAGHEKGPRYAAAFLSVLAGEPSAYARGGGVEEEYGISRIEREAKRFFDATFGVDREKPAVLKRDIETKAELLARYLDESAAAGTVAGTGEHSPNSVEAAARESRVSSLQAEITALEGEYARLAGEVSDFDYKIEDASERRRLLEALLAERGKEKGGVIERARKADDRYHKAVVERDQAEEKRRRMFLRLALWCPVAAAAIVLVLASLVALVFRLPFMSIAAALYRWGRIPGLVVVLGYLGWATIKFVHVHRVWEAARAQAERLKHEKINALRSVEAFHNTMLRTAFDHALHGGLIVWILDFRKAVRALTKQAEAFVENIAKEVSALKERFEELRFRSSVLIRNVASKAYAERQIETNPRLRPEVEGFFKRKPLSAAFREFCAQGTLSAFLSASAELADDVFSSVRQQSIEQYLSEYSDKDAPTAEQRLQNLYSSAKAFILLDIEKGQDVSADLVYLGVDDAESSFAKELLARGSARLTTYSTDNRTEVVIAKLKVGFPAFHVAAIKYGRTAFGAIPNSAACYSMPEFALKDLFPSAHTLGDEGDEPRQLATLAHALGLLEVDGGQYWFGGRLLGRSLAEVVAYLRSMAGSDTRLELRERIESRKREDNALERLEAFKRTSELDRVDQAIVDRVISEISPLA